MILEIFKIALHLRDWHYFMRQSLEWGFVDELGGYGFESCCFHVNSGKYISRVNTDEWKEKRVKRSKKTSPF